MTTQKVENLELFSEAELEALELLPEELEGIESELHPNLESISLKEIAKDLEAYFEGDIEQAGLERGGRGGGRGGRGGGRGGGGGDRGGRGGDRRGQGGGRQDRTKGTCYTGRGCDGRSIGSFQHCHNCKQRGGKSIRRNSGGCERC
ncbi:hypothetical protein [Scytonema sp. NUACC26]|uniref:hypothetical protein n=1 Tax=Scytonema sp. NUACC26 TaxID=3140176 RepID=UPI0034DC661E